MKRIKNSNTQPNEQLKFGKINLTFSKLDAQMTNECMKNVK